MTEPIKGGCLCGAVRYSNDGVLGAMGQCQCEACRKTSGSGHRSHLMMPKASMAVSGEITIFEKPAESGNVVGRAFCPTCGSPVYSLNSGFPDHVFVSASSLDDPEVFRPMLAVWTSNGPSWDHLDPALPKFETQPPLET